MSTLERSDAVARFARLSERIVASPYAPLVTLLLVGLALYALPSLGFPPERVADVHFLVGVLTLLLVFLLEHNERRDTTAIHVKLDEIMASLNTASEHVDVEERPAEEIEDVRRTARDAAKRAARRSTSGRSAG